MSAFSQEAYFEDEEFHKESCQNQCLEARQFNDCLFDSCNFSQAQMHNCFFSSCLMKNCNFSLTKVKGCRLQRVCFVSCKLVGIDFSECDPRFLLFSFESCLIDSCNFSCLPLQKTVWKDCTVRHCIFTSATSLRLTLEVLNSKEAFFTNATLQRVIFA